MLKSKAKYQNALLILNMIITYGRLRVPSTILQRHIQYQREVKASPVLNIFQKEMCHVFSNELTTATVKLWWMAMANNVQWHW